MRSLIAAVAAMLLATSPASAQEETPGNGAFLIESQVVGICFRNNEAGWPRVPHLTTVRCNPEAAAKQWTSFLLSTERTPAGSYIIRHQNRCLTQARGVVLGPPAADLLPCDGKPDQLFQLEKVGRPGDPLYRIRSANGGCVFPRFPTSFSSEVVVRECDNAHVRFHRKG